MTEPASNASTLGAAAQSLRDTAKWLVGGVVATAAGVFAGSSLTAFGSLTPSPDPTRLALAVCGLVAGFVGLALILKSAIQVLTRESMTFYEIAMVQAGDVSELGRLQAKLLDRHRDRLPSGAATFRDYMSEVQRVLLGDTTTQAARDFLAQAKEDNAILSADASFMLVRSRFDDLVGILWLATPLVALGFGLFAWAANPPKPQATPPAFSLTIQGVGQR